MKNKKSLILLSVTGIFVTLLVGVYIRNKYPVSDLTINNEIMLGNVNLDSKKNFKVFLTNSTEKDFEIEKIYTSCGCTKVTGRETIVASFIVKHGETVDVNFEFDPSSMHKSGDNVDHEVYFLTTSPVEKEYKIKITGKVM